MEESAGSADGGRRFLVSLDEMETRAERWQSVAGNERFDPAVNLIPPKVTVLTPAATYQLRQFVLALAYQTALPTGLDAGSAAIAEDTERVFFWGDAKAVSLTRSLLARRPGEAELREAAKFLGTATMAARTGQGSAPAWELTRTGNAAPCRHQAAPALVHMCRTYLAEHGRSSSIYMTARNCWASSDVTSGIAIHRINQHALRSMFLGFAPWYVLEAGHIEILDYREIRPVAGTYGELRAPVIQSDALSPAELSFVNAILSQVRSGCAMKHSGAQACSPIRMTHQKAAASARCPIDLLTAATAAELRAAGFGLAAIELELPARSWICAWCRPDPGHRLTLPYYASLHAYATHEASVVKYLATDLRERWPGLRG